MGGPWTPEEYRRQVASAEEDIRILESHLGDARANAEMLRARGHEWPAEVLEHSIRTAEERVAELRERLEDDE
jgi:hypothetical protein